MTGAKTGVMIARVLSLLVLLLTGVVGVYNGLSEWGEGRTALQHLVTVGVLLYGSFGLLSAYGLARRRSWSRKAVIGWAICVTYVPGLAVMVYGGKDALLGSAIAASAGSAVIAAGVIWTVYRFTRKDQLAATART